MRLSPEIPTRGELSALSARRPRQRTVMAWCVWSRRGRRTGRSHIRVLQELGRPCALHGTLPDGDRITTPGSSAMRAGPARANYRRMSWYRQAKEHEARRDGGRESERLIVPLKPGNPPRGDPVEGRGRRAMAPLGGNTTGAQSPDAVSTQHQRKSATEKSSRQPGFYAPLQGSFLGSRVHDKCSGPSLTSRMP